MNIFTLNNFSFLLIGFCVAQLFAEHSLLHDFLKVFKEHTALKKKNTEQIDMALSIWAAWCREMKNK